MENVNKELTPEEIVNILKNGDEVLSGGLRYTYSDNTIYRIDSNDHPTAIGSDIETFSRVNHCYLKREYYLSVFDLEKDTEYYAENCETIYRRKDDEIEYLTSSGEWKKAIFHTGIPRFCPVVEKEYVPESWLDHGDLSKIISIIESARITKFIRPDKGWIWTRNPRCKYIDLRIDMRDGDFVLLDRSGQRISIEELEKQR